MAQVGVQLPVCDGGDTAPRRWRRDAEPPPGRAVEPGPGFVGPSGPDSGRVDAGESGEGGRERLRGENGGNGLHQSNIMKIELLETSTIVDCSALCNCIIRYNYLSWFGLTVQVKKIA